MSKCAYLLLLFALTAFGEKDPTLPAHWNPQSLMANIPKDIKLTGIFVDGKKISAIINGKQVHVNEFINEFEIIKMDSNLVYLKNKEGIFVIPLIGNVATPVSDIKENGQ